MWKAFGDHHGNPQVVKVSCDVTVDVHIYDDDDDVANQ